VSKGNRNQLRGRYRDGIIRKALRGHPLGLAENRFSDLISKHRFRIKQCPGTMKRVFGLYRSCYFDFIITHVQLPIAATGQYLLKAAKKSHPPHKNLLPHNQNGKTNINAEIEVRQRGSLKKTIKQKLCRRAGASLILCPTIKLW